MDDTSRETGKVEYAENSVVFIFYKPRHNGGILLYNKKVNRRLKKQVVYGIIFNAVWVIPFVAYLISLRPAPSCFDDKKNQDETNVDCGGACAPCVAKNAKPPEVIWENVFPITQYQVAVGAKIRNSNLDAGALPLSYEFHVFGPFGAQLHTFSGVTALRPGETKFLIEGISGVNAREVNSVKFVPKSIEWRLKEDVPLKKAIEIKSLDSHLVDNGASVEILGRVANLEADVLRKVIVKVVVTDIVGLPVLASKTELHDVVRNEERGFRIVIPVEFVAARSLNLERGVAVEAEAVE